MRIALSHPLLVPVLALCVLAACAPRAPTQPAAPPVDRLAAECRLLVEAAARMVAGGSAAHDGLTEGCPGSDARDTRPLAVQMDSLRAATAAPLPHGMQAGTRAETVFRRMITRGVPPTLATVLTETVDFRLAAN